MYQHKPSLGIKNVLLGIQALLDEPNMNSPACDVAYRMRRDSPAEYARRVRTQTNSYLAE